MRAGGGAGPGSTGGKGPGAAARGPPDGSTVLLGLTSEPYRAPRLRPRQGPKAPTAGPGFAHRGHGSRVRPGRAGPTGSAHPEEEGDSDPGSHGEGTWGTALSECGCGLGMVLPPRHRTGSGRGGRQLGETGPAPWGPRPAASVVFS